MKSIAFLVFFSFMSTACAGQSELEVPMFGIRLKNLQKSGLTAKIIPREDDAEIVSIELYDQDGVKVGHLSLGRYSEAGRMDIEANGELDGYPALIEPAPEGEANYHYSAKNPIVIRMESWGKQDFIFNLLINAEYKDWLLASFKFDEPPIKR